jgi:hypothetical protein
MGVDLPFGANQNRRKSLFFVRMERFGLHPMAFQPSLVCERAGKAPISGITTAQIAKHPGAHWSRAG